MANKKQDSSKHISELRLVRQENYLNEAALLIMDLQAFFHEVFLRGLHQYDLSILRRCKAKLSTILKELDLYNLYLKHENIEYSENGSIKPLQELPGVYLLFHMRDQEDIEEAIDQVRQDNSRVGDLVGRINQIIQQKPKPTIDQVKERYASDEDGFLIRLPLKVNEDLKSIYHKIDLLREDVQHLSLDELMISQQFSEVYGVEYKHPFWLKNRSQNEPLGIYINIFAVESFTPFYYLSVLLETLKRKIELAVNELADGETDLVMKFGYESLNRSYVLLNIETEILH